jgi:serine phosphatase RsbU (regulator of sigma subunit)
VLATDGLTEARDLGGRQLNDQGAMALIAQSGPHAQELADELIAKVRKLGGNRLRDDLAILAVRVVDGTSADA